MVVQRRQELALEKQERRKEQGKETEEEGFRKKPIRYRDSYSSCSTSTSDMDVELRGARTGTQMNEKGSQVKNGRPSTAAILNGLGKTPSVQSMSSCGSSNCMSQSCLSPLDTNNDAPLSPSSTEISPFLAHYHKYSADDLALHVSIAQGGLQRIRREAHSAQVSLRDIVDMFGKSISKMARNGDAEIERLMACGGEKPMTSFNGTCIPKISVSDYLWRIVRTLNAHSDPALFASDGSDLSMLTASSGNPAGTLASSSSEQLDQQSRESSPIGSRSTAAFMSPPSDRQRSQSNLAEGENSAMGRGLRCLLLAFVYIDRACNRHPNSFRITSISVHRILLAAIYVATKFTDDTLPRIHWTFAKLGGVGCRELKLLEGTFCSLVDFRFYVTEAEFQAHCMEQLRCAVRSIRQIKEMRPPQQPA